MDDNDKMVISDNENDEDSDNSSSSDDGEEKELENRAVAFERELSDNKYLYEVHVEVTEIYRKLGDLKSLRAAYDRFSQYFPLTPAIWLAWIKDEIKLANSSTEKKHVLSLFDKAVEDYSSIDVWLEYVQFCIGNCELEETYKVLERGLNTVGLNASQGSLLWDALRELELAHLALHEPLTDQWHQQLTKVADAFKRQLSVPLLRMESTYLEWQQWLEKLPAGHKIDPESVEWPYQKALKLLNEYIPFEDKLLAAKEDEGLLDIYKDYIKIVKDPATVLCLYERAVTQLSLNTVLWNTYCSYTFKLGNVSHGVSKRALRNCPWSEDLWIWHMRILEEQKHPNTEVMQCLEQGLNAIIPSSGLNLWLTYLEYIRRSSESEYLHKVFTQASEQLGEDGDPSCKILRLQARIFAREGNMEEARRIWTQILHSPSHKNTATAWLEYASLEKQYGNTNQLRVLYKRAISTCTDWPEYIAEDWLMYERECGSLQDVLGCVEKCNKIKKIDKQVIQEEQRSDREYRKRAHESNGNISKPKRTKIMEKSEQIHAKKKVNVSDIDPEKSVFLSNMHEVIDEDRLQQVFPTATAICMPINKKGSSNCFAYVQFADKEEAEKALTRDREPIDGRPLFISKCQLDHAQRKNVFKYATRGEENKLFVRGLPLSYTENDIEEIFKPHGAIAVRLVTYRSGRSKGLAYVEFTDQEMAKKAMEVTDQLEVGGHTITVAISAPPPKKSTSLYATTSLNFAPMRHARSRLQVPLIPRSIKQTNPEVATQGPSKSNDDFRKMLLNKK